MGNILGSLVLAVVVAWLAARFALSRFYRERWWEKKYGDFNDEKASNT